MTAPGDAAIWYAQHLHWPVFPVFEMVDGKCACGRNCASPGKHPRTPNGVYDATTDPAIIAAWWEQYPNANIGVAMGTRSGATVLDIDPRNGGDESLEALLEKHGPLPDTVTVETGGGGRHYYFEANGTGSGTPAMGIDLKSDGGYVLAPPSNHRAGHDYRWLVRPRAGRALPPLPDWLHEKRPPHLVEQLESMLVEGARNDALTSAAGTMRRRGFPENAIVAALLITNQEKCQPPLLEDEVRAIAHSVAKYDPPPVIEQKTEIGNARRLAMRYGKEVRFLKEWGWVVWDGKRWQRDDLNRVRAYAIKTVEGIYQEVQYVEDENEQKELLKHAKASQTRRAVEAVLNLAESVDGIVTVADTFDRDPWLFNVENGTVDLRTGDVRPHDRADSLTTLAPVRYDPNAKCPRFLAFLDEIMAGNQELTDYLQRWFGYCLTADTREQILLMFYGLGANGKTTLLGTIGDLMGQEYAKQAPPGLLIAKQHGDNHPTELADLYGSRFVITSESGRARRLAEELIKQLVGGEKIKARFMRRDFFEFAATFKLVMMTNNKPNVAGADDAIWRRIKLVPFLVQIPEERQDRTLREKVFAAERSGILNWLLEGCLLWQREGMQEPEIVRAATSAYREQSDPLAEFLADCCYLVSDAQASASSLFKTYEAWAKANGDQRWMNRNSFGRSLTERGLDLKTINNVRSRVGIGLKMDKMEVG